MSVLPVLVSPAERRRAQEFAQMLDGSRPAPGHELESLVGLTTALIPARFVPRAEFRTTLRESLVAEAAQRRPATAPTRAPADATPRRHRVRTIVASGVLVSLLGGVGAAAASTHAVPGDPLYGLKRGIESVQLSLAHSDLSRGRELLDQADSRLSEAETLAASDHARTPETTARIETTLTDLTTATRAGSADLEAAYADTGDVAPLLELQRFVADQQERLADLSALLSPDLRALIAPLSELLVTMQARLATLTAGTSSAPGLPGPSSSAVPGHDPAVNDPLDRLDPVTGAPRTTAKPGGVAGTGGLGHGGGASTLRSPVPHVSVPVPVLPSLPVPLPTQLTVTPPSQATLPCVPILPLTTC